MYCKEDSVIEWLDTKRKTLIHSTELLNEISELNYTNHSIDYFITNRIISNRAGLKNITSLQLFCTIDSIDKALNENNLAKFYTPNEINNLICVDRLKNDTDKFLMLAAFEGLSGKNYKEISDLRISDIDFKNNIAKTSLGREVKLSNRLAELAQLAHDEESYMGIKGERVRKLMPSDKIIKPYVTQLVDKEYRNGRRLYSRLKKMFEVLEMPNMTCKLLRDFGIIDTILKECRKKNITPYDYTRNRRNLERINTQYGTKFTTGNISSYYQKYETIFNEG